MLDLMLWKQNWQTWMRHGGELQAQRLAEGSMGHRREKGQTYLITTGTWPEVLIRKVKLLNTKRTVMV